MRIQLFLLAFILSIPLFGQRTLIPYRFIDQWGVANFFVEMIVEPKYEEVRLFDDQFSPDFIDFSLARIKADGKYGFINEYGEEVIAPMYDEATDFNAAYALVSKGGERFVIDTKNTIVQDSLYQPPNVPPNHYSDKIPLEVSSFPLTTGRWKKIYEELGYKDIYKIYDNRKNFLIKKTNKWGVVQNGKVIIPVEYDSIHPYSNQCFVLYRDGKKGVAELGNSKPILLSNPEYDEIKFVYRSQYGHTNPLIWYRKNDLWGFVNYKNKLTEPKYNSISISKERDFLYELITNKGRLGYYQINLDIPFFTDTIPLTNKEIKPFFVEAERYANKYLKQALSDIKLKKVIKDMEAYFLSGMLDEIDDKKTLYYNFSMNNGMKIYNLDTLLLSQIATILLDKNIIVQDATTVSPKLIATCKHLQIKYADLITRYPKYPFSQIVNTFKTDIINDTNPGLINSAMKRVLDNCDFDTEFYQKVVFLYKFYSFAYLQLVKQKKLDSLLVK